MTKKEAAARLATRLTVLARDVMLAGAGDERSMKRVKDHIDGYWHILVIGGDDLKTLIDDDDGDEGVDLAALTRA